MNPKIKSIFQDNQVAEKIKKKLPVLFSIAELECSRAGRVGMEVGSLREKILVAMLIHFFGNENVETEIPITKSEVDVKVFDTPISIKTVTTKGRSLGSVKIIWTVDAKSSLNFRENYHPSCDLLLVKIKWGNTGNLFYIPLDVQQEVFSCIGRNQYITLPKPMTNPRGATFASSALKEIIENKQTINLEIFWKKQEIVYETYKRWTDMWEEE
ncbi:MAG: ThaI family type II restriction endonuclease [Sedimentisphaerales bacterium]